MPKRSGLVGRDGAAIENLSADPTEAWAHAPDPEQVQVLDRLLQRIPARYAEAVRRVALEGVTQVEVARDTGISQPSVWLRLRRAHARLRSVAALGVDLTPEEVRARLLRAGEALAVAVLVSTYWREHTLIAARYAAGMMYEQARDCLDHGAWTRRPELADIAEAVRQMRTWPRIGDRSSPNLAKVLLR